MNETDFPALFTCADDASNWYQRLFLWLIRVEYFTLILASLLSMSFIVGSGFYAAYAFVLFIGLALLLIRSFRKPEQDWYRCRALAESVKTLTWRYMMRAAPFQDAGGTQAPRAEFRNQLTAIFSENRSTAEKIAPDWSANDQITEMMDRIHKLSQRRRMEFYIEHRVDDQRKWYAKKASDNRRAARNWVTVGVLLYITAIALSLARVAVPAWEYWPIDPIIVAAASVIGWMQIKKFNELAAAYTVAAHEIGLIRPMADAVDSEEKFSEFVNDAEMAFSREHTLWIARQSN